MKATSHLPISSYPNHYESYITCKSGDKLLVRPIWPEDAPLMVELFESLSPQSIYRRFFTKLTELPQSMLARFTQIDYDREIALVAISFSGSKEKMVGVARVVSGANIKRAECAVLVADQWQRKGIGSELLKRCLEISHKRGIKEIFGIIMAGNKQMLALGKKMGLNINWCPSENEYDVTIDLSKYDKNIIEPALCQ